MLSLGLSCHACGQPAVSQWQRRATDAEWASEVARCRQRAAEFGYDEDTFVPKDGLALQAVNGCSEHAVSSDLAAGVHADTCGGCNCTPAMPEETGIVGVGIQEAS